MKFTSSHEHIKNTYTCGQQGKNDRGVGWHGVRLSLCGCVKDTPSDTEGLAEH